MKTAIIIAIICGIGIVVCVTSIVFIATNASESFGKRNQFDYDENSITISLKSKK